MGVGPQKYYSLPVWQLPLTKRDRQEVEKHPWKTLGRGQRENSRIPTESETRMRLPHVEENPTGKRASGSSWEAAYWAAKGQGLG